jgi:hypothetical protein
MLASLGIDAGEAEAKAAIQVGSWPALMAPHSAQLPTRRRIAPLGCSWPVIHLSARPPACTAQPPPRALPALLQAMDQNGDGLVELQELAAYWAAKKGGK